ncbi:glutathione S-transferase [Aquabacterium parvum]|uniref:glutathione S-transferase n=1 Tax=Aquabacterium parvum TaxID=70584 RepID=UPI000AA68CA2|nr:glutathione S-transferase [Aquabacterium parvum]
MPPLRLIGMLDSPYVRRVAISMHCLGVAFEHEAVSVVSTFAQFQRINPVVKAPTLVCPDGEVLMDSSLILQFIEAAHSQGRYLWPSEAHELQHDFCVLSLAMAACDKGVQSIYERKLRPADKQHGPWLERVRGQLVAALAGLEQAVARQPEALAPVQGQPTRQAGITAAIAWQFVGEVEPSLAVAATHPVLAALAAKMESTEAFKRFPPVGPGVSPPAA